MELIMAYLHNYFYRFKERGRLKIEFNSISRDGGELLGQYTKGQYVRIVGSSANDGVYKVLATEEDGLVGITLDGCLIDEEFEGYICSLGVPRAFIELSNEINKYIETNPQGGYISESFGGYSYTKATGTSGGVATWKDVYAQDLRPYRRMSDGFKYVKEVR